MIYETLKRHDLNAFKEFLSANIRQTFQINGLGNATDIDDEIQLKHKYAEVAAHTNNAEYYFVIVKASKDGPIVGCGAIYAPNRLIQDYIAHEVEDAIEIGAVLVAVSHQRRGLSQELFKRLLTEAVARGYKRYCFDSGYQIAQRVWTKLYGPPDYVLHDIWGEGHHQMIWVRDIPL